MFIVLFSLTLVYTACSDQENIMVSLEKVVVCAFSFSKKVLLDSLGVLNYFRAYNDCHGNQKLFCILKSCLNMSFY